jgi:S-DNA-T family DNA segregation ATPase FtsK/SpoIIIE
MARPSGDSLAHTMLRAFEGHAHDAVGILILGLGLLSALSVYADLAGPVGEGLETAIGALVGMVKVVVPVALIAIGLLVLRGPDVDTQGQIGLGVGTGLLTISACGLLQVGRGEPEWAGEVDQLERAGGAIGALFGIPLEQLLATAGATVVFVVVAVIGIVLVTRVPLRVMAGRTASGVRPVGGVVRRALGSLFELRGADGIDLRDSPPAGDFFDQDADAELEPAPDAPEPELESEDVAVAEAETVEPGDVEQLEMALPPGTKRSAWKLPKSNVLERTGAQEVDRRLVEEDGRRLERALAEHGVETRLVGMVVGPTVTRYELELGPGVKVARVTSLHKDIAYAMASPDVRILAPIPGKQALGVEVPNARRQMVTLGDLLSSDEARRAKQPLEVALGRDISGKTAIVDLATMPHVLIAGATGAGKSSCINSLITSLLMRSTPDQVRLILVDPKRVELGQYNRLPHLLTQVVTDPKKAANALAWAVKEMERRYDLLSEVGVRDIAGYNAAYDRGDLDKLQEEIILSRGEEWAGRYPRLPFIVVVVDELNDLMMVAARDVEESICRIAQMARAVGIHLVIATQRPSVNVITGVIKANIPTRLAFAVSSLADSRVILDQPGAERLIGRGDMLYLSASSNILQRIQGAWVTEEEVRKVVAHWRRQAPEVAYVEGIEGEGSAGGLAGIGGRSGDEDDDELLEAAMELVVETQLGSTSMLQRKLKVGFARAGRLMDLLEQRGVVGPSEGSKARAVLMTPEELSDLRASRAG